MSETRKIAAILVADVVGYSRLAGADEDRTLARLRALHSDLIEPAIAVHHGRIVKRTGDGFIAEFRSVVGAARSAIEVQTGMVERNAGLAPETRIELRIGAHLGDVVEEADGDLMGDGVNIAARLESIAAPGGICVSEDFYRQVKGRLDLKFSDLGPKQLKNIAEPIRVYSLDVGQPARATPMTAVERAPPKRRSWLASLAAGIAALLILIAGAAWHFFGANRSASVVSNAPPPLAAQRLSIVVLPFANLSGDPAQDYLVDALTDELTTGIARIRDSFVIARNTAFTFKGKPVDAKTIGKDLGVRYVLEGSVQLSKDQVRVNAQLIDADSGAHLWAEQFDTPRADLLQTQDEIVTHLARAMDIQLPEAEAARLKRAPAANPDAEDLALQCQSVIQKSGYLGEGADAASRLCEQALSIDPNNIRALTWLSAKFLYSARFGHSADPYGDLKRADDLESRALALDPNYARAHSLKGGILRAQGRLDEAIAEHERALALDPALVNADAGLGVDYMYLGQFEKSLEFEDKAIRLSPHDPALVPFYSNKAADYFGLKQYDQAIDSARRAITINPNDVPGAHATLVAALALTGHETEAREALQRYLALPITEPRTIAAWKAYREAGGVNERKDPRLLEMLDRGYEALRKAGMPEE
jgi:TolB-like protein/class 3 adenylate cyclase